MKLSLILLSCCFLSAFAETHWESIILAENNWSYFEANSEPDANWNTLSFDDSAWKLGAGGLGYDDGDDATIVDAVSSLYLRKAFQITDLTLIKQLLLDIDYDDGFVAYINGVELARSSNVTDENPTYDSGTSIYREALMYAGGMAEQYELDMSILLVGENVLAVQILNYNATSSDLSALVYLEAQINSDISIYQTIPSWFSEPVTYGSSNLPIIKINTNNKTILDDPKISAHMGIINNGPGELNHLTDSFTDYDGYIGIELRGQSSLVLFPKKSYGFETRDDFGENFNVNLLGMPKENDWILYAPYSDKSLMRNVLTFEMAKALDMYSSRTVYCELFVNDQYQGIYVLMEKIKRDDSRVDVDSLLYESGYEDTNTGGYIFKVDKIDANYTSGYTGWTTYPNPSFPNAMDITYQYVYPKPKNIEEYQATYLKDHVTLAEKQLIASDFADKEVGYNKYLNMGSFVDFMLINEVSKEVDKYRYSTYFHKKKDSKGGEIFAGPIWDFNLGYGNVDFWDYGNSTEGWLYTDVKNLDYSIMFWWMRLMQDPYFAQLAADRYQKLRESAWSNENVSYLVDSLSAHLASAQERNFERWPVMGTYVWPNKIWQNMSFESEVQSLETWMIDRLEWMDANLTSSSLYPEALFSVLDEGESSFELTLEDAYFNHRQLKKKYFSIKGDDGLLGIDSIYYVNSQKALLFISYGEELLSTPISIRVDDNIITTFENLNSNELDLASGIQVEKKNNALLLYTEHNDLIVSVGEDWSGASVSVYDIQGKIMSSKSIFFPQKEIFSHLDAGIYLVCFDMGSQRETRKVVIP